MGGDENDIQYSFERSRIWKLKLRLQHSGWLQYVPPFIFGLFFYIVSFAFFLLSYHMKDNGGGHLLLYILGSLFRVVGGVLTLVGVMDILIIKFRLLPWTEPLPPRPERPADPFYLMRHRRSCRSFQTRLLKDSDRMELLKCVQDEVQQRKQHRFGVQPIRLEYIKSSHIRVWPTVNTREFLVAIGPETYNLGCIIDVGRTLQGLVLHATELSIGTCLIGPGADQASVVKGLVAEGKFDPVVDHVILVCALGYPSKYIPLALRIARALNSRLPLEQLFFADTNFGEPLDTTMPPFDRFLKCCEAVRWSPSSFNAQPTRCVGVAIANGNGTIEAIRFDFYVMTASRFYAPTALGIWLRHWDIGCNELGIKGRFEILAEEKRKTGWDSGTKPPLLPRYCVSWLMEEDSKQK